MHTHLSIARCFFFVYTLKTKLCCFLYINERFFYGLPLAVATRERWVYCNEETILVLLNNNGKPALMNKLFH